MDPIAPVTHPLASRRWSGELGGDLVGLILYGSAIHGGLRPDSDLDLLAIVKRSLTPERRSSLTEALLRVSGKRAYDGPGRPAEVTIVVADDLSADPSDIATDFQYGEWLRDEAEAGSYPARHHDPDLVLVLAMARSGKSLTGPAPEVLLPEIPRSACESAIVAALPSLLDDLEGDERNVVLTVARMQLTMETGGFASKDAAAERIAERVPPAQAQMLRIAAAAYRGEAADDWRSLRPALLAYLSSATGQMLDRASRGPSAAP